MSCWWPWAGMEVKARQVERCAGALGRDAHTPTHRRRASASSTSSATATGCAFRSSLLGACACLSGVVEAGCKLAIGARLKRAGMHWTVAGANAIVALRCCKLSGRFEDFWERRAAKAA